MRALCLVLFALLLITQYPLWWGKGGWLAVHDQQGQVRAQQDNNAALRARNNALQAEVNDLKAGGSAVAERARSELNMIGKQEYFVQILPGATTPD